MNDNGYYTLHFPEIVYGSNLGALTAGSVIGGLELQRLIRNRLLKQRIGTRFRKSYPYLLAAGLTLGGFGGFLRSNLLFHRYKKRLEKQIKKRVKKNKRIKNLEEPEIFIRPLGIYYSPELEKQLLRQIGSL